MSIAMAGTTVDADAGRTDHAYDGHPETMFEGGVLHMEIHRARDIIGDEFKGMGRADPFLKVKHGITHRAVTLKSEPHQDGGSNPTWGAHFEFPLVLGGAQDHNILDIEIWNRNRRFRRDNILGYLRIGRLADWITGQTNSITEPAWYPVFTRPDKKITRVKARRQEKQAGEILMKFYFQKLDTATFQPGFRTEPRYHKIDNPGDNGSSWSDSIGTVDYELEDGSRLGPILGRVGKALGVAQSSIILLGVI